MPDRALEIASLLLREGTLRNRTDADHRELYTELMTDDTLMQDVRARLAAVGYELHQDPFGWMGVRVSREAEAAGPVRGRTRFDARHVRLVAYFWVHLVYRKLVQLRRGIDTRAPGAEQSALFESDGDDEPPWMSFEQVKRDFSEVMSLPQIRAALSTLRQLRFVAFDEKRDKVWADAGLFVYVDGDRMEDFVIELARSAGGIDPTDAVTGIATRPAAVPTAGTEEVKA
jgi:hypothetical protein